MSLPDPTQHDPTLLGLTQPGSTQPGSTQLDPIQPRRASGSIFLVGMMGSGKTTVGKMLAKQMGKIFIDSDVEIQHRTGVSIPHIFDVEGEAGFRQREACVIQDLVQRDNIVLATGGGSVLIEQNRTALRANGVVVYLKGSVHDLWLRTRHDCSRPLLQIADPYTRLKELHAQRDPIYMQLADLVVHTGKQSAHNLVLYLEQQLQAFAAKPLGLGAAKES